MVWRTIHMMTPATKFLDSNKIQYNMYKYECDAKSDFGHLAAEKLGRNQNEVFKTLLIHHEKTYVTAVIPVNCNLNLKRAAKLAGLNVDRGIIHGAHVVDGRVALKV